MRSWASRLGRREFLAATTAFGLTGCQSVGTGESTTTAPLPDCESGDTGASDLFDRLLVPLRPGEYTGSTLILGSLVPGPLSDHGPLFRHSAMTVTDLREYVDGLLALPYDSVDRVSFVRPPGPSRFAYVVVRSRFDREVWWNLLKNEWTRPPLSISRGDSYRGYRTVDPPKTGASVESLGYTDAEIVAAPTATDELPVDSRTRFERLVDLRTGHGSPVHCSRRDLRLLLERLRPADLVRVWYRTDDGTFGEEQPAPPGSNVAGFVAARVDPGGNRQTARRPSPTGSTRTTVTAQSGNRAGTTARAVETGAETADHAEVAMLTFAAVFPEDDADEAAFERTVSERWTGHSGLAFEDPAVERHGRVLTATEQYVASNRGV